jgi:uncharacterized membrane protein
MHLAKHTILIARPREAVFDFFLDFSQASRWRQYVESMQLVGDGPPRAGSRVRTVMNVLGGRYAFELEVLACDRPSLWRHRTFESDFRGDIEYRFDVEGDGTRVTMTLRATPAGVYGWLALPLMLLNRRKSYAEQLPNLKRVLEER